MSSVVAQSKVGDPAVLVVVLVAVATPERLPERHQALLLLLDQGASEGAFAAALEVRAVVGSGAGSGVVTEEASVEEEEELAIKAAVALGEEVGMVVLPLAVLRTVMAILHLHLTLLLDPVGIAVALAEDSADHLSTEA